MATKTIKIGGMSCNHCVMAVTKALSAIEGVENVRVNLDRGEATYEEKQPIDADVIRECIEKAGYKLVS